MTNELHFDVELHTDSDTLWLMVTLTSYSDIQSKILNLI